MNALAPLAVHDFFRAIENCKLAITCEPAARQNSRLGDVCWRQRLDRIYQNSCKMNWHGASLAAGPTPTQRWSGRSIEAMNQLQDFVDLVLDNERVVRKRCLMHTVAAQYLFELVGVG